MNVPEELEAEFNCLKLVADGVLTYTEVSQTMSIDDVDRLGIVVDLLFDARNAPA